MWSRRDAPKVLGRDVINIRWEGGVQSPEMRAMEHSAAFRYLLQWVDPGIRRHPSCSHTAKLCLSVEIKCGGIWYLLFWGTYPTLTWALLWQVFFTSVGLRSVTDIQSLNASTAQPLEEVGFHIAIFWEQRPYKMMAAVQRQGSESWEALTLP